MGRRVGAIAVAILFMAPASAAPHEIMIGWKTSASAPDARTLTWSDSPELPVAAVTDLVELRTAIDALEPAEIALLVSDDGRRAAAARVKRGADAAPPSGVTIWPDWRDAARTTSFPDASQIRFLSNHHLLLSHHPEGGPYVSWVVDLRRPETQFHFTAHRLDTLSVTDSGRWAALTRDGALVAGQLDPTDSGGRVSVTGTAVPVTGAWRTVLWRHDGRFLLVEQEGPEILSLDADDWSRVSTIEGGLGPVPGQTTPIGIDACVGYQPGVGECVFTTSSTGELAVARWPHQIADETIVSVSPLRTFVVTQRRDAVGIVERRCRRTPGAAESGDVPSWSAVPRGTKIQHAGWLLWNPAADH